MGRSPFEIWDENYVDERAFEDPEQSEVRCKYCRERGLFWEEARGERNQKKWVLVDEDGEIHACKTGKYAPTNLAEDF